MVQPQHVSAAKEFFKSDFLHFNYFTGVPPIFNIPNKHKTFPHLSWIKNTEHEFQTGKHNKENVYMSVDSSACAWLPLYFNMGLSVSVCLSV